MGKLGDVTTAAQMLRQARLRAGLSLRELAARTGVGEGRIGDYEHGRHQPSVERLQLLLRATGHDLIAVPRPGEMPPVAPAGRPASAVDVRRNGAVLASLLSLNDAVPFAAMAEAAGRSEDPPTWRMLTARR